jgi:hypothetical protein
VQEGAGHGVFFVSANERYKDFGISGRFCGNYWKVFIWVLLQSSCMGSLRLAEFEVLSQILHNKIDS